MQLAQLTRILDGILTPERLKDYCPNGLQVEGRPTVHKIVTGVTASLALLDAAIAADADAILVHHGYFWRGEDGRIVGARRARIARLIQADVSLFAYHLPLDVHPELGNNAQLAKRLGLITEGRSGEQDIVCHGRIGSAVSLASFAAHVEQQLDHAPLVIGESSRPIARLAWCTGGAQGYFEHAIALGVDAYITGEASEQQTHMARESGVAFIAAGHHATERFGVRALGEFLAVQHGLEHRFIDIPNPV